MARGTILKCHTDIAIAEIGIYGNHPTYAHSLFVDLALVELGTRPVGNTAEAIDIFKESHPFVYEFTIGIAQLRVGIVYIAVILA